MIRATNKGTTWLHKPAGEKSPVKADDAERRSNALSRLAEIDAEMLPNLPNKIPVTIRLDAEVVGHWKATGKGWQTRLNAALRTLI